MTTTVKRGAGRSAATARTSKHSQRTALPPKGAQADVPQRAKQRENFEAAISIEKGGYGRMTVPELRARLDALTGGKAASRLTKGQLMNYILEAERKAGRAPETEAVQTEQELPPTPATEPAAALDGARKGIAKAERVQVALEPYGWATTWSSDAARVVATAVRGAEVLTVVWDAGVFNYDETGHAVGDRVTKVRNVSAAVKLGSRTAEEAAAEFSRVVANKRFKMSEPRTAPKRHGGVPVKRSKLPFDAATVTEDELWAALGGNAIEWINRVSNTTETAVISKRSKFFRLIEHDGGRTVQFTAETGFRACRLQDIVRVGGSTRRRTQPKVAA